MTVTAMRTTRQTLIATCCCHWCKLTSISQLSGCQEGSAEKNTHHLNRLLTSGREMSVEHCGSIARQLPSIGRKRWETLSLLERHCLDRSHGLRSTASQTSVESIWAKSSRQFSGIPVRFELNPKKNREQLGASLSGQAIVSGSNWPFHLTATPGSFRIYGVPVWDQGAERRLQDTINLCHFKPVSVY